MPEIENPLALLQREVQQKLGGCMMQLLLYERALKAMVASMALEGPVEQLADAQARREADLSKKTLGALVGVFTGGHLNAEPLTDDEEGSETGTGESADPGWGKVRITISMPPELHQQTKQGLAELVAMRNDLVHHLLDRFDVFDASGCRAASLHLDDCYEKVKRQRNLLHTLVTSLSEARARVASYCQSKEFEDAFVDGVNSAG